MSWLMVRMMEWVVLTLVTVRRSWLRVEVALIIMVALLG
jgi:hypothetical protein